MSGYVKGFGGSKIWRKRDVDARVDLVELCDVKARKLSGNCCLWKFYEKGHGFSKGFPNAWNQKLSVVEDRSKCQSCR